MENKKSVRIRPPVTEKFSLPAETKSPNTLEFEELLEYDTKICPFCGEEIKAIAIKCRYCGSVLDESAMPLPKKNWTVYLLLWLILGNLGAHRLYMGNGVGCVIFLVYSVSLLTASYAGARTVCGIYALIFIAMYLIDLFAWQRTSYKVTNYIEIILYIVISLLKFSGILKYL